MAYCPECGAKVSITDKRCSRCGCRLGNVEVPKPKMNNLSSVLAFIGVLFSFFSIFSIYYYSFIFYIIFMLSVILGIIGAYAVRNNAKLGAFIIAVAFVLMIPLKGNIFSAVFYIAAIVTAVVSR